MENTDAISLTYGQTVDLVNRIEQLPPLTGAGVPTTNTPAWYVGQIYIDTTTNETYYCVERPASGATGFVWKKSVEDGRAKKLTAADRNANSSDWTDTNPANFNCIALWKLSAGIYNVESDVTAYFDKDRDYRTTTSLTPVWIGDVLISQSQEEAKRFLYCQDEIWYTRETRASDGNGGINRKKISPPDVVQQSGTSTTSVMSQNAVTNMVTNMVYADPDTKSQININTDNSSRRLSVNDGGIQIGRGSQYSAYTGQNVYISPTGTMNPNSRYSTVIGYGVNVGNLTGAIALGAYSNPTSNGEMNIGSTDTHYGYNSSNYRLLSGLYDGQSAHDAVNLGQLQNAILNGGTTAPTTATVGAVGTLYSYVDTTGTPTPHLMVCTAVTDVSDTVTYTWTTLI